MDNPSIDTILTKSSQILVNGGDVFATGGGFASSIIATKLKELITNEVLTGRFMVLDTPELINVTGMKLLDL